MKVAYWPGCVSRGFTPELHGSMTAFRLPPGVETETLRRRLWNEYRIEAVGSRIRTFINGKPCVDLDDPKGARRGIFAFQIHAGGAMEVRFKDIKLEVPPPKSAEPKK